MENQRTEFNSLDRKVYRREMAKCLICHDAPCTNACETMDPAKKLRSVWFDNDNVAAAEMPDNFLCALCEAPCESACVSEVSIKRVMTVLDAMRNNNLDVIPDYNLIKTDFCGIELENPFLLSSSVVSSTYEMCARALDAGWAGVAFKTVSLMDIHETSPRFSAVRGDIGSIASFKNIEQLSDHSLVENLHIFRKLKDNYPNKLLLASIMGRNEEEWEYLARIVTEAGADALELNFSCPNMTEDGTGSDVGQIPELVEKYTAAARRGSSVPILAKLTPNVETMSPVAEAAKRGGADGLAAINTIKSLIHTTDGSVTVGGLSGRAVKPIALRFIAELGKNPNLKGMHISGMGGIETWRDAMEFIAYGAGTVQITTAVMEYGYRIIDDLRSGMASFLKVNNLTLEEECVGGLLDLLESVDDVKRDIVVYPKFIRDYCAGCGRCYVSCMDGGHQALSFNENRQPILDPEKCVGCHLCILVCPCEAIVSSGKEMPVKKKSDSQS